MDLWTTAVCGFAVVFFLISYILSNDTKNRPPCYNGWIPWLGCALEFGKNPLVFIEQKRKELGPIYTLKVAGERLTFVTEEEGSNVFFQSSNIDFQKAVQGPVQHVASVTEESFFKYHTKIHDMLKGKLAPSMLYLLSDRLCKQFQQQISSLDNQGSGDLNLLVRETMYAAVINNLFGDSVLPTKDKVKFKELEMHFVKFDDQFEYGSKLPPFVLREWSKSKHWLLSLFKEAVDKVKTKPDNNNETVLHSLLKTIDEEFAPNYGLLLLWASLANAIPITFWCLVFIYKHKEVLSELQKELTNKFGEDSLGKCPDISEDDIRKLPYLRGCVLECIRLRSPGLITRRVVKPLKVGNYNIPVGDMLMLSPYWAHRNTKYFPDPEVYKPERWLSTHEKNTLLDGFVGFGGGRYSCPGKWFALLEIQMYVAMFIQRFDVKLLNDKIPSNSKLHVVGTQQPDEPCPVTLSIRKSD